MILDPVHSNICLAPWVSFQLDTQGFYQPCCVYKGKPRDTLDFTDIKDRMLFGEKLPECRKCWRQESNNIKSRREMFWEEYADKFNVLKTKYLHIDLSLGNTCNLSCRMCSSYNSSSWYNIDKKIIESGFKRALFTPNRITNINEILSKLKDVEFIEIKGGEPFYEKKTRELIEAISNKNITLEIVTNGTEIPDWFLNCGSKFKNIELVFSLEGIEAVYEYVRGTSFSKFEKNINKMKNIENIKIGFQQTITNYAAFNIREMSDWCNDITGRKLQLKPLFFPEYLALTTIPIEYREEVLSSLNDSHSPIFTILNNNDWDEINYQKFKEYVRITDNIHKTNLFDVVPQFKKMFEEY